MRLTRTQIRELLARYEAAETSIAEERTLRAALSAADLPEEFRAYRQWFSGLEVLAKAPAPERAGPWSVKTGDTHPGPKSEARVRSISSAPLTPPPQVHQREARVRPLWVRLAIAAALIGLIGFGVRLLLEPSLKEVPLADASMDINTQPSTTIDWSKYEVTDPAEARRITRAALAQVSTRLRRGSAITAGQLGRLEPISHLY